MYQHSKPLPNDTLLNQYEANELKIVKQAILKSSIEGGVIKKHITNQEDYVKDGIPIYETDEQFLERWIKWVFRNTEKDKKLTQTEEPF